MVCPAFATASTEDEIQIVGDQHALVPYAETHQFLHQCVAGGRAAGKRRNMAMQKLFDLAPLLRGRSRFEMQVFIYQGHVRRCGVGR